MTAAHARTMCCRDCPAAPEQAEHHDLLLTVDVNAEALLALLEMAVTWHELDYSESPVVGPAAWLTFVESHDWADPELAERVFNLAVDIVGRRVAGAPSEPALAAVIDLVRS
jgi:hypothetical protein